MSEHSQAEKDALCLRAKLARWDAAKSGPDAFAIYHEIVAYLLEGDSDDPNDWTPLRRLLDALKIALGAVDYYIGDGSKTTAQVVDKDGRFLCTFDGFLERAREARRAIDAPNHEQTSQESPKPAGEIA